MPAAAGAIRGAPEAQGLGGHCQSVWQDQTGATGAMGNQMPARCVVPCNPVCCAMCINPGAGRMDPSDDLAAHGGILATGSGGGGKSANIFANAASVLSMAAEEISLDDNLEQELAGEVELWRMETSGHAVQQSLRETSKGFSGLAGVRSCEGFAMPFERDRSLSPPPRTQVSLHDRAGLSSGPQVANTGLPRVANAGAPSSGNTTAEVRDRIALKPSSRPTGSAGVRARSVPPAITRGEALAAAVDRRPVDGDADAAAGISPNRAAGTADAAAGGPKVQAKVGSSSSIPVACNAATASRLPVHGAGMEQGPRSAAANAAALGAAVVTDRAAAAVGGPPPAAMVQPGSLLAPAGPAVSLTAKAATITSSVSAGAPETVRPVPRPPAGRAATVAAASQVHAKPEQQMEDEASSTVSSSDESTFAGFIEDPLEKERSGEVVRPDRSRF